MLVRGAVLLMIVVAAIMPAEGLRGSTVQVLTFDAEPIGRPPGGFDFLLARGSSAARWLVERQDTNAFVAHGGDTGARGFSLAVLKSAPHETLSVSARLRRAGTHGALGLVWRLQDADNYYLARLDLDSQDIGLYRVVNGNRIRIEGEDDLELDRQAWHTMKVVQDSDHIRVYLGGIGVLRARDRTFEKAGRLGLWCTAETAAHFDDLKFSSPTGDASDQDARSSRRR